MSFYGSGYGPPHGYQTSQPYEYPPSQAYAAPPFLSSTTLEDQHATYNHGTVEAYKYNHTAIPGLGMGFSHDTASWQTAWPPGPVQAQTERNGPSPMKQTTGPIGLATKDLEIVHNKQDDPSTDDDAMEEGEVSEGELEDIYEPGEVDAPKNGARGPQGPRSMAHSGRHGVRSQIPAAVAMPTNPSSKENTWNGEQPARDRSGSYSPYLSPREIQSNGLENGASHAQTPRSDGPPQDVETTSPNRPQHVNLHDSGTGQIRTSRSDTMVLEIKKRAQDAILRLWPLNVRYQNYIEEGVDKTILDQLFKELGLDSATGTPTPEKTRVVATPQAPDASSNARDANSHLVAASNGAEKQENANRTKDKSEERKDRIARLLAAKGSKPTAMPSDDSKASKTSVAAHDTTAISKPEKTKAQSEKSKLIQQKMEALMKAREANAKATQAPTSSMPVPSPAAAPESDEIPRAASADAMNLDDQPPATVPDRTDTASAPSIPGLFLSSSAPSPAPNHRKRPVAADLNEQSTATTQKRPFGQARDSRPFLIDVSDDEDDAEMEIDSPELRPSSIQRPTTPGSRTMSFREHPALPDSASQHAVLSPKTVGTPTSNVNSKVNLENMNKKIEDMRRKIAEAEARKKAKLSNNGSPSLPQSQAQSKEGSVDAVSESTPTVSTPAMSGLGPGAGIGNGRSPTPLRRRPSLSALESLPKTRAQGQQARPALRARVASERLPILEARRREQTVRLEHLQSEVARIEKEIQDSLAEEERLKQDALQPESESASRSGEPEPEAIQAESVPDLLAADETVAKSLEQNDMVHSSDEAEQDASMDESSSDLAEAVEAPEAVQVESTATGQAVAEGIADEDHPLPTPNSPDSADHVQALLDGTPLGDAHDDGAGLEEDVAMEEVAGDSNDDDEVDEVDEVDETSDEYEPTEAGIELPSQQAPSHPQSPVSQAHVADDTLLETTDADMQGVSAISPIPQTISTGDRELGSDDGGEVNGTVATQGITETNDPQTSFIPYETPLHYFRAYRFHPLFEDSVSGGLRSLTYSNKIDVTKEVCPDQLTEGSCPRGNECPFQHFEEMQAPAATDDQILLQLGAYGNYEGEQQQDYVAGLRELLTDFRNRKVKDFQTISQGIIEYRAKFHGDKSKVLPLGGVTL
ncbi:hypothetical protein ACHAPT_000741 [Fusarium lateritium]